MKKIIPVFLSVLALVSCQAGSNTETDSEQSVSHDPHIMQNHPSQLFNFSFDYQDIHYGGSFDIGNNSPKEESLKQFQVSRSEVGELLGEVDVEADIFQNKAQRRCRIYDGKNRAQIYLEWSEDAIYPADLYHFNRHFPMEEILSTVYFLQPENYASEEAVGEWMKGGYLYTDSRENITLTSQESITVFLSLVQGEEDPEGFEARQQEEMKYQKEHIEPAKTINSDGFAATIPAGFHGPYETTYMIYLHTEICGDFIFYYLANPRFRNPRFASLFSGEDSEYKYRLSSAFDPIAEKYNLDYDRYL